MARTNYRTSFRSGSEVIVIPSTDRPTLVHMALGDRIAVTDNTNGRAHLIPTEVLFDVRNRHGNPQTITD